MGTAQYSIPFIKNITLPYRSLIKCQFNPTLHKPTNHHILLHLMFFTSKLANYYRTITNLILVEQIYAFVVKDYCVYKNKVSHFIYPRYFKLIIDIIDQNYNKKYDLLLNYKNSYFICL